jgi:hypothetical protein
MGHKRDWDVVRRCADGICTQKTKHEGPPEMRRKWWIIPAEKGGMGGSTDGDGRTKD